MIRSSVVVLAVLAVACSSNPIMVTPRSFDRPSAVAFVCYERANDDPVPLERCDPPPPVEAARLELRDLMEADRSMEGRGGQMLSRPAARRIAHGGSSQDVCPLLSE